MRRFWLRLRIVMWYVLLLPFFMLSPVIWIFTGFGLEKYVEILWRAFDELE
nr:MAG TPA: hypothetical protein [Caudoviricetes sp.]